MPVVASATLEVTPVMSGAQQSITQQLTGAAVPAAEKTGQQSGSKFSSSLVKGIAAGSAAVAGAVAGVSGALIKTAGDTAAYGDQIDKASQKLGVSSTFYQEWEAVLQHSGTSMDKMSGTFKKLATASQDASDDQQAAFEKLGLSMDEVSKMSPEELFQNVISGLQGMEEGTERTSLATTLLGKGAMEMGALLNTSAEDTQGMIDKVHELGGVMDEDAIGASARYQDSLQDMQTAFEGVKNGIGAKLLPVLADFMDKVAGWVTSTDLTPLTDMVGSAVDALGDFISNLDIQAVGEIFQNTVTAIGTVLGTAWDAMSIVFDALKGAFDTISDALSDSGTDWSEVWNGISGVVSGVATVIGQAIGLIAKIIGGLIKETQTDGTLFNTIWEGMQTIVETVGGVIKGVIDTISAILDGDWKKAWDTAMGTVDSATKAIDGVVSSVFGAVGKTITDTVSKAKDAAAEKFQGIKEAASEKMKGAKDAVEDAVGALRDGASEKLESLKEKAGGIFDALKGDADDKMGSAKTVVTDAFQSMLDAVDFDWSLPTLDTETMTDAYNTVSEKVNDFLDALGFDWSLPDIGTISLDNAGSLVSDFIDDIMDSFDGIHLSLPDIQLPHLSVSWEDIGPISIPHISVDWYAKAYANPYMFTTPTVVGNMGFGDGAGGEIVYGHDNLMRDIREAAGGGRTFAPTINVYTQEGQDNEEIARYVMDKMKREYDRSERIFA